MPEPRPDAIDAAVTRLFALLGVTPPREGSVVFDFHEDRLQKVRPTPVITVRRRDQPLASDEPSAHTQRRT